MDLAVSLGSSSLEFGSIYAIVVLGLVASFRIAGFADLTMEGSFTTGAAVSGVALVSGVGPWPAMGLGALAGATAGACTGVLHTRFKIDKLLAGIIMMTVLYTVNLRIMERPNLSLQGFETALSNDQGARIVGLIAVALTVGTGFFMLLRTEFGFFLRAAGENAKVVVKAGRSAGMFTIFALVLSNGLIALAGALAAQNQGFADVGMGGGLIVVGLASLVIGETLVVPRTLFRLLLAAIVGAYLYQLAVSVCLRLGISPWDLKLATGFLLAMAVIVKRRFAIGRSAESIGATTL